MITQTLPYGSPGTVVFWCGAKDLGEISMAKYRWGRFRSAILTIISKTVQDRVIVTVDG